MKLSTICIKFHQKIKNLKVTALQVRLPNKNLAFSKKFFSNAGRRCAAIHRV